jgi:superfamily II DNA or RNA helicase
MTANPDIRKTIAELERRLCMLDQERKEIAQRLAELRALGAVQTPAPVEAAPAPSVTMAATTATKIALFRSLFRGREDVFPRRWDNAKTGKSGYSPVCRNEWVRGVCSKPQVKCSECPNQAFQSVTDKIIRAHLQGRLGTADFTAGVYPMLPDETCWFLAADFDKRFWQGDIAAFRETARAEGVAVAVERSRSGNGAHAWIFFAEPVQAAEARRLGALLITATMDRYPDIGFDSYDRFFPAQDTMPAGGFGNLIALPLQAKPRESGNSVFIGDDFQPFADQWAYLSSVRKMTAREVSALVATASEQGRILRVRIPVTDNEDEPWTAPPSRKRSEPAIDGLLPENIELVLGNCVYVDRASLPPALISRLIRLAAFQNPEFYAAQAMRLPTFGKPRIISCAELFSKHAALPRGCLDDIRTLLDELGVKTSLRDERQHGSALSVRFQGELRPEQRQAVDALRQHDTGVLAATTAFGKTVVAAHMIAERGCNTLVLVHRRQLLDQWVARLGTFLDAPPGGIGVIHGGKKKPAGSIDVALMQSLVRQGVVSDLVANYGHLIVDECHHLSAVSFEAIAREAKARYVLGLSATVARKDGHHPIILMQCGPVRYRVDAKKQAAERPFEHKVVFRQTNFRAARSMPGENIAIQELYAQLAADQPRNDMIFGDILAALEAGRSPVVITERKDHLAQLADRLSKFAKNIVVLQGGMGTRELRAKTEALAGIPETEERLLIATGRYLGEGFDDARLDTLFLTMPISWRGTLAQYAGRLHRLYAAKREVIIFDYVDACEPMLAKIAGRREAGYRFLGYKPVDRLELGRLLASRSNAGECQQ